MLTAVAVGFLVAFATGADFGASDEGTGTLSADSSPSSTPNREAIPGASVTATAVVSPLATGPAATPEQDATGTQSASPPADSTATPAPNETPTASPTVPITPLATAAATATPSPTVAAGPPPTTTDEPTAPAAQGLGDEPFTGMWRIVDRVTAGPGVGSVFTFDVALRQSGAVLSGAGGGVRLSGTVDGATAEVSFSQPGPQLSGTFTWTLTSADRGFGAFSTDGLNSGTSELVRID